MSSLRSRNGLLQPVAPVAQGEQAAQRHQQAAAPDPVDEGLVVHPHAPGPLVDRLAERDIDVAKNPCVDGCLGHRHGRGEIAALFRVERRGTDRVAEVARILSDFDVFVNVQGDEPEIAPDAIDLAVAMLEANPHAVMSTLATPIRSRSQLEDRACVKVVCNQAGAAMYFSRSPIPCVRDWDEALLSHSPPHFLQHVGLYAYRREFLLRLAQLPPSPLEQLEKLEQLRVLAAGYTILVGVIDHAARGIDTPEDYRAFVSRASIC